MNMRDIPEESKKNSPRLYFEQSKERTAPSPPLYTKLKNVYVSLPAPPYVLLLN
jgi:hypothetical protein